MKNQLCPMYFQLILAQVDWIFSHSKIQLVLAFFPLYIFSTYACETFFFFKFGGFHCFHLFFQSHCPPPFL